MSYREREPKRIYYQISFISEMINVAESAIRFWIKAFGIDTMKKSNGGKRMFAEKDVVNILAIYYLIYDELYTLKGAKKKFDLWRLSKYEIPKEYITIPDKYVYSREEEVGWSVYDPEDYIG